MQMPTKKTPVSKCINLSRFAEKMLSQFPSNATLAALAATLTGARGVLAAAQYAYVEAVSEIVGARAEVRWVDYVADNGVRRTIRAAEDADGCKGGRIVSAIAPGGVTPIIKPVGATQAKEMRDLEGRLEAAAGSWDAALQHKVEITKLRTQYEAALESRRNANQKASDKRAARDAAKEDFLDVYAEVASRVKAEFPRDRRMQDLFFDVVTESTAEDAGGEGDEGDEEGVAPAAQAGAETSGAKSG